VSEAVTLVPVEDQDLPDQCWKLRQQGFTPRQIARKLMLSLHEVQRALDEFLPKLDAVYRRRVIAESLMLLEQVITQHMNTIGDPESASVVIRSLCERRFWVGVTGSTDPVQLVQSSKQAEGENSLSPFKRGIDWLEKWELLARDGRAAPEELETKSRPDDLSSDDPAE
jgi:hypothetical protein